MGNSSHTASRSGIEQGGIGKRRLILGLILLLFSAFLIVKIKWEDVTVDLGGTMEARQKPFLAAQNYLQTLGKEVHDHRGGEWLRETLSELPTDNTALFINANRYTFTKTEVERLLTWVDQGGRLIVAAQQRTFYGEVDGDPLFDALEVSVLRRSNASKKSSSQEKVKELLNEQQNEQLDEQLDESLNKTVKELTKSFQRLSETERCSQDRRKSAGALCSAEVESALVYIGLQESSEVLMAHFDQGLYLVDESAAGSDVYANDYGNQMLRFSYGRGGVTLISEDSLWRNGNIELFDHAFLLQLLLKGVEKVWLVYDISGGDHWIIRFWHAAWPLVVSFALLMLLYIWKVGQRFGPPRPESVVTGRDILEHIDAGSQFYWSSLTGQPLIESLQIEVSRLIAKRFRYMHNLTLLSEQGDGESGRLGIELSEQNVKIVIEAVSTEASPITAEEFVAAMRRSELNTLSKEMSETIFLRHVQILKQVRERL